MNRTHAMKHRVLAALVAIVAGFTVQIPAVAVEVPPAPTDLRVVDVTPFSVDLDWDGDWYGPTYLVFDESGQQIEVFDDGRLHGTVTGLEPATTYTFTLRARHFPSDELSPPSEPVTFTTPDSDPIPVPTNLRVVENETGTEVKIAFDVAEDPRISGYEAVETGNRTLSVSASGDTHLIVARNLDPQTEYEFTVSAFLSTGAPGYQNIVGEPSEPVQVTTVGDSVPPPAPSVGPEVLDRTGTSVSLEWGKSYGGNVGVTDYVISNGETTQTVPVSGIPSYESRIQATFTALEPETGYTFTVRARDAAGNLSEPTEAVTISTGVDPDLNPPAPVTGLQGSIDPPPGRNYVTWNASTDNVTLQRALTYRLTTDGGDVITLTGVTFYFGDVILSGDIPLSGCEATVVVIDGAGNESQPRSTGFC